MKSRSNQGFTIVEVLIAIGLLATLTGMMWASISSMYKTRDVVEMRTERFQMVRVFMRRTTNELSSAYLAGPEFGGEDIPGEELKEDENQPDARERVQYGMVGSRNKIDFTTFGHLRTVEGEKASFHAEIGYFLRNGEDEEGNRITLLMRREDTSVDDDITKGGTIQLVFEDVEDIKFEYWDTGAIKIGSLEEIAEGRWVDTWDTSRREFAARLPSRIRITLTLPSQGEGSPEVFTTQTHIHITEVLEYK